MQEIIQVYISSPIRIEITRVQTYTYWEAYSHEQQTKKTFKDSNKNIDKSYVYAHHTIPKNIHICKSLSHLLNERRLHK